METFVLSWMLMLGALTGAGNFPVDMFETTSHQFGTVVRGAKTEYEFVFTNKYVEDVVVESVRSSCQCTTPTLLTPGPIKTHQKGRIKIHINTDQFTGNKNATITVRFAAPVRTEMQLHSYVYIRSDVSVNPGIVYFGSVDFAKTPKPAISVNVNSINYGWKILDVKSECKFIQVGLKPLQSYQGTTYNLIVYLLPNAPPGPFSQVLELETNDDVRSRRIPVRVEGRIKQTLSASPSPLTFNRVEQGKSVEKTLIIQGAEPFKIVNILSEARNISASLGKDQTPKKVHPVKLTYTAGKTIGDFNGSITILTDLEGGMNTSVQFNGKVIEAVKPVEEAEETEDSTVGKANELAEEKANEATGGKADDAAGEEAEESAPDVKETKDASQKKSETLDPAAETEEEADETSLDALDADPQTKDGSEAGETEKDEESLDLLDLPAKEDASSQNSENLSPDLDGEKEPAGLMDEPADELANEADDEKADEADGEKADEADGEKADEADGEKADEADGEKADEADGEKADEADGEKADEADGEKADEANGEKADEADGEKADKPAAGADLDDEFKNLLPDEAEDPSADSEKAGSASAPKAKIKGRNLLKKK